LYLRWSIVVGGSEEAGWSAVLSWKVIDSNKLTGLRELGCLGYEAVLSDLHTLDGGQVVNQEVLFQSCP
jgi:hypothetical protein